ncbi:MAG: cyclic nucleotide-binding domain-containing protein [Bilophila sp.]
MRLTYTGTLGEDHVVMFFGPGCIFNETSVLTGDESTMASFRVLERTEAYRFPASSCTTGISSSPTRTSTTTCCGGPPSSSPICSTSPISSGTARRSCACAASCASFPAATTTPSASPST